MAETKSNNRNNTVLTTITGILIVINIVGGWYGASFFYDKIQPYVGQLNNLASRCASLEIKCALAEQWRNNHDCVIKEVKEMLALRPTGKELQPELEAIKKSQDALRHDQNDIKREINKNSEKIDKILFLLQDR